MESNRDVNIVEVSNLSKTWLFDLDGTVVVHNGYKENGECLLDGAKEFFAGIPEEDKIILLTSRKEEYRDITETFLKKNNLRYDYIIFGLPYGERILINDKKPLGMHTALAINTERNIFMKHKFCMNDSI